MCAVLTAHSAKGPKVPSQAASLQRLELYGTLSKCAAVGRSQTIGQQ